MVVLVIICRVWHVYKTNWIKGSTTCRPLNKVEPCFGGFVPGWVTKTNTPCGNNFFFFHSLSKAILKTAELPSLVWCRFFYFWTICSSFRHVRIRVYIYNIVQSYKQTARPVVRILLNSLDFWSSKTITSILLLSIVLLKPIHAMTFRTKFLLFVSICVPPNNPITACGATSFPGYHSFPNWAIH